MTVEKSISKLSMKIQLDDGIVNGKQKIQNKTFNKIKLDAKDLDLCQVGEALSSLYAKEALGMIRVEEAELNIL